MAIWDAILDVFEGALRILHTGLDPIFGVNSWGWSIIALTILVRLLLLPLAIKQTRSMRAMQALQPKVKELQKKYKVDRDLMRKDPERYKAQKQKLSEETMALYKEEGVNPASGCLPLLAQAPIFFALFSVLRDSTDLANAPFYFFTSQLEGLGGPVSSAGWPGWLLIALMGGTMFWSQRQMMARNNVEGAQAQQQKILMYVMPVFLAVVSFQFPLGVLLYWVTTNFWQMGQQAVILREVRGDVDAIVERQTPDQRGRKPSPGGGPTGRSSGADGSGGSKGKNSSSRTSGGKKGGGGSPASGKKGGGRPAGGKQSGSGRPSSGGAAGASRNGRSGSNGQQQSKKGRASKDSGHLPRRGKRQS